MDVQTPVTADNSPFTMADARAEETKQTQATDGTAPIEQEPANPTEEPDLDNEPPFLKKEEEPETEDLDPDNEIDELLKGEPDEKRRAEQKAGIQKLVTKVKAEQAKYQEANQRIEPVLNYLDAFDDPTQYEAALADLTQRLNRIHGKFAPDTKAEPTQSFEIDSDEDSVWASESASQTKARWMKEFLAEAEKTLLPKVTEKVEPLSKWHEQQSQKEAAIQKVEANFGPIHGRYPFATKEMVASSSGKYPSLEPMDAFRAMYADEIGSYAAEWAGKRGARPNGPQINRNSAQPSVDGAEPATSMAGIKRELGLVVD